MFETEVDYRLAKWLIANMKQDGVISDAEMQKATIRKILSAGGTALVVLCPDQYRR